MTAPAAPIIRYAVALISFVCLVLWLGAARRVYLLLRSKLKALAKHRELYAKYSTHDQALDLIEEGRPYGLLLRGFEREAYEDRETFLGFRSTYSTGRALPIEGKLVAALGDKVSFLTVANPAQTIFMAQGLPRLELPREGWEKALVGLIKSAYMIVVYCQDMSPGLAFELNTILEVDRAKSTVIILANESYIAEADNLRNVSRLANTYCCRAIYEATHVGPSYEQSRIKQSSQSLNKKIRVFTARR
jgi:hypothetical protein